MKEISIRVSQLHMPLKHTEEQLRNAVAARLSVSADRLPAFRILKRSLDARKKHETCYVYDVAVSLPAGTKIRGKAGRDYTEYTPKDYVIRGGGEQPLADRPVVIGGGPAGLFAAYCLARGGYRPLLIERGEAIERRAKDVEEFFATGVLRPDSNVQFGIGGAGAFSDGKLNTLIKDREGRCAFVLKTLADNGAPAEITYINKPHVGTDRLREVVSNIAKDITDHGGTILTNMKVTGFTWKDGALAGVRCGDTEYAAQVAILAIGHSARDTFEMLAEEGLDLSAKAFAMGVRVQHPREWVDRMQYGDNAALLPAADYKLTHTCENGRGVYTFCMCPGGYVVNASSEPGRLAINGMSNHDRSADNSNSAVVVTVSPEDCREDLKRFGVNEEGPLAGMYYQRKLEELAYQAGKGAIPTQRFEDYQKRRPSTDCGSIRPVNKGAVTYAELHECLPGYIADSVEEGLVAFDRLMPGYGAPDVLLQAIESRTSSPVRIERDEQLQANGRTGLYPCGEGAGYAGGIMSAAIDGIRVSEQIMMTYRQPADE